MESTNSLGKGNDVLGPSIQEDLTLEQLGYHQGMSYSPYSHGSMIKTSQNSNDPMACSI